MPIDVKAALAAGRALLDERDDAERLLAHVLAQNRGWLIAHSEAALDAGHYARYQVLVERRVVGEPLAYLTGHAGFWSLDLMISPATLIPRPETELLVEQALERMPVDCDCADLGTGSGAVALALARERPQARIVATDTSAAALAVARNNAERLGFRNVTFVEGDWCAALGDRRFDLVISNPPYIEAGDHHLGQGDLRFEPLAALVSGTDGLDAIRSIVGCAGRHLVANGWLLFEHGWTQGAAARSLLAAAGYVDTFTALDLEGRDRVSGARMR